jgi:DNA-binding response OmpR family regulator
MKLLLVEDEKRIANVVVRAVREAGYAVDHVTDGREAISFFEINDYDLVVLDLLLPGISGGGHAVCKEIRTLDSNIPILMMTALDAPADKVKGLDMGADDYLVKPFHLEELLARIRALLRRSPQADPTILQYEDLRLDTARKYAYRGDSLITLSAKEFAVLEYFMKHPDTVINQSVLIEHAWDSNYDGLSNVVETYIRYLRKKLSPNGEPNIIQTKRGMGYILEAGKHV